MSGRGSPNTIPNVSHPHSHRYPHFLFIIGNEVWNLIPVWSISHGEYTEVDRYNLDLYQLVQKKELQITTKNL